MTAEGQIKSEWIYEIIYFQKNDLKNLKDVCPERFYSIEILQISQVIFWKIDDFINPFWVNLTFSLLHFNIEIHFTQICNEASCWIMSWLCLILLVLFNFQFPHNGLVLNILRYLLRQFHGFSLDCHLSKTSKVVLENT